VRAGAKMQLPGLEIKANDSLKLVALTATTPQNESLRGEVLTLFVGAFAKQTLAGTLSTA
jgi:hypothetical protein